MNKYDSKKFISALASKRNNTPFPKCAYCGGERFTTTDRYATILIGTDLDNINIGPSIPAGIIICENCGHIELFAVGSLGLLARGDDEK